MILGLPVRLEALGYQCSISQLGVKRKFRGVMRVKIMRYNTLNMDILQILDNDPQIQNPFCVGCRSPQCRPQRKPDTRHMDSHSTRLGPGAKEAGSVAE